MKTVLVCGSHERGDKDHVFATLDAMRARFKFTRVVTGGAPCIDTFAILWCMYRKVDFTVRYANWDRWGNMAGPVRNREMLREQPDAVIAFPGGNGTLDMIRQAREAGIDIHQIL